MESYELLDRVWANGMAETDKRWTARACGSGVTVDLCEVRPEDRDILARMLDAYLLELVTYRERVISPTDSQGYTYFDAYFSEVGRYPFLIRCENAFVGLALIRSPLSTGRGWEIAEFYIAPEHRRVGVGHAAVASIFLRFPGNWELQVHRRNHEAVRFWLSCVRTFAHEGPEIEEIRAADGGRLQLRFRVDAAG